MIFLTLGSHEPFDRLVAAVDEWCSHKPEVIVHGQITDRGKYRPKHFSYEPYLDIAKYEATCRASQMLIAHAGMGSIITALTLAKPIVIMPRRAKLHEMRNDHQVATARHFAENSLIHVAMDETELPRQIDLARQFSHETHSDSFSSFAQDRLIAFLRQQINL